MSYIYETFRRWYEDGQIQLSLEELERSYRRGKPGDIAKFSGFIVLHGTDTICSSSQTYTSFMLGPNCPFDVLFTCAQQTVEDPLHDIADNLGFTFQTKNHLETLRRTHYQTGKYDKNNEEEKKVRLRSILNRIGIHGICAGRKLFYGPTSAKTNDQKIIDFIDSYDSKGPIVSGQTTAYPTNFNWELGLMDLHERLSDTELSTKQEIERESPSWGFFPLVLRGYDKVCYFEPGQGQDAKDLARQIESSNAKAVILQTLGSFTLNRKSTDAAVKAAFKWEQDDVDRVTQAAENSGKLIFAVSPSPTGRIDHAYVYAGSYLTEKGIIPLMMTQHAARAKFLYAVSIFGDNQPAIMSFMIENNFRNEQLYSEGSPNEEEYFMKRGEYLGYSALPINRENSGRERDIVRQNRDFIYDRIRKIIEMIFESEEHFYSYFEGGKPGKPQLDREKWPEYFSRHCQRFLADVNKIASRTLEENDILTIKHIAFGIQKLVEGVFEDIWTDDGHNWGVVEREETLASSLRHTTEIVHEGMGVLDRIIKLLAGKEVKPEWKEVKREMPEPEFQEIRFDATIGLPENQFYQTEMRQITDKIRANSEALEAARRARYEGVPRIPKKGQPVLDFVQ